jgi:hypothetical protein
MSTRTEQTKEGMDIIIDGFESGISSSPYTGIANIRNLNTYYYPKVAYVNYKRQLATTNSSGSEFFAGTHSTNVSNNVGWLFSATDIFANPVGNAVSPAGLIYVLDSLGQVWKQSAVNSTTWNYIGNGSGRAGSGSGGIAYWNNYIAVFGGGLIEWCGDGTGDSTITSSNWNLNYDKNWANNSVFTTAYATNAQINGSPNALTYNPVFLNGDPITFTTTGTLPAPLATNTTYYLAVNNSTYNITTWVSLRQKDTIAYLSTPASSGNTSLNLAQNWDGITGNYIIVFSTGENRSTTLTNGSNAFTVTALTSNETISIQVCVKLTSDGSGVQTVYDNVAITPFGNCTSLSLYFPGSVSHTSATFDLQNGTYGSYVDPLGNTITGMWKGASGIYNITTSRGEIIEATFTHNSPIVEFALPIQYYVGSGSWSITLLNTSVTKYVPYVSKVSSNLLFSGGNNLSEIIYVPPAGSGTALMFSPAITESYSVSIRAVSLPIISDTITDMVDLKTTLVITGQKDFYIWDYVSGNVQAPNPVGEQIYKIWNLLSNVYILAGNKGNIYVTNGYSAQLLYKLPDYIAGYRDPVWSWGDMMSHRSRLFFQALAQDTSGNNLLAGVFSLQVSPALTGEQANGLNMEAQNSYGLIPASGSSSSGFLVDNSQNYDSYYSGWSNGSGIGGIDYNNTTLWGNNEPVIETDIVPIGNYLIKKTLGSIEFKLDRPLASGDSVALYWRPSLSDAWVSISLIDTATGLMSNYGISAINQSQWAQFMLTMSCASSSSSRVPFRELRLHLTP